MWAQFILLFVTSLAVDLTKAKVQCTSTCEFWLHSNETCPPQAICAVVKDFHWYGRRNCNIKPTITTHYCRCQSGLCPVGNDNHRMFHLISERRYTCEPTCQFIWCASLENRTTGNSPEAQVNYLQSPEFHEATYQKFLCRCPEHHNPKNSTNEQDTATAMVTFSNRPNDPNVLRYKCRSNHFGDPVPDPCRRQTG
ncbi:hypothetical protein Btru_035301 [Bulinus truncatus]|nr:hypothetical protein Btru_035301 [Bulinus truncatus]